MDLGQDYYLLIFTCEEDQYSALIEGPWLIYDKYFPVREWSPNFCPTCDAIEEVAIWVHILGLAIEYYDDYVLSFIDNRIAKTVKVDRNTLSKKRGGSMLDYVFNLI